MKTDPKVLPPVGKYGRTFTHAQQGAFLRACEVTGLLGLLWARGPGVCGSSILKDLTT